MRRQGRWRCLAVFFLLWLLPLPARPCSPGAEASRSAVLLHAETVEYMPESRRLVASGRVSVVYGTTELSAERVEVDTQSGVGTAEGNVRLRTPQDDLRAERLDFELTGERGVLYHASGTLARTVHVAGQRLIWHAPQAFTVEHGRVTTCPQAVPDWEFRVRTARLGPAGIAVLRHPSFWIKGIPVFYLPYFFVPLREKRTTGFLLPRLGLSRRDGALLGTEFFWAIADWIDTTLGLEYLSATGWRPSAELRYAVDPLSEGQLRSDLVYEPASGRTRWKVLLQQQHEFGRGLRGLSQLDVRSERAFDRRFARDVTLEAAVQSESFVDFSQRFASGALRLHALQAEALTDGGRRFRRLPELRGMLFPTPFLGSVMLELEAAYSRLQDTAFRDETPVQRLDLFPRLLFPAALSPWLRLTLTTGGRVTFYDRQVDRDEAAVRLLPEVQAHLSGPTWQRRFATVLHLVTVQLAYRYVPAVPQDDLPAFDTLDAAQHFLDPLQTLPFVDRIAAASYAKLALVQHFFARERSGWRPLARLRLSQGFDFRALERTDAAVPGPLEVEADAAFRRGLALALAARLLPARGLLQGAGGQLRYRLRSGWSLHVAAQYRRDPDVLYTSGGVQLALWPGLEVGYGWRLDGLRGVVREQEVMLHYRTPCWDVALRFRFQEGGDTLVAAQVNLLRF
ncbi:MAG: LPS-assembly protein LptD [Candidatus Tectimicrobiota bacterium]|nr:MAG: LPS-assembly protein LptD [Candidatus Tectomicrobia bacterium]